MIIKLIKDLTMSSQPIVVPTFSERLYTYLNIGIVLCSLVESYVFPFAIIKWMIVLTKYGGLVTLLGELGSSAIGTPTRQRFKYSLRLLTSNEGLRYDGGCVKQESHVSVITEVVGDNEHKTQLSYCGQNCTKIPPALGKLYGAKVQCLDLSYNNVTTLKGLEQFTRLEELVMDNNQIGDAVRFPYLPTLKTLSLNNNSITDLEGLLERVSQSFPSLSYISLLSNRACPDQLSDADKDDSDYQRYRYFVIHKLPCLRFLDSRRVWSEERSEAMKRGMFTNVRRPAPEDVQPPPQTARGDARPLPVDFGALGKHKGAYGKVNYKYTGKHSEGNRFILNSDL